MNFRDRRSKPNHGRGPQCKFCCDGNPECVSYEIAPGIWNSACFLVWEELPETRAMVNEMKRKAEETIYQLKLQRFKEGCLRWYEKDWRPNEAV